MHSGEEQGNLPVKKGREKYFPFSITRKSAQCSRSSSEAASTQLLRTLAEGGNWVTMVLRLQTMVTVYEYLKAITEDLITLKHLA